MSLEHLHTVAQRRVFLGSREQHDGVYAVLVGAPMDWTVSYRPGSRFGPAAIREVSEVLEEYSVYQDRSLDDIAYYDAGDLVLPFGNAPGSLQIIAEAAAAVYEAGCFPLFLGGEHLVSLPLLREARRRHPNLAVVHLDAHADLRSTYLGQPDSHASVMRRALEEADAAEEPISIYQLGIRSGTKDEFELARRRTHLYPYTVLEPLRAILPELQGRPVYLTLDIDVADPAFAPGTGTPEPGGVSSRELLDAIHLLQGLDVIGADVVEVCPAYDSSGRTQVLAAEVVRELLLQVTPS